MTATKPFSVKKHPIELVKPEPIPAPESESVPATTANAAQPQSSNPVLAELRTLLRQSSHYLVGMVGGLALGFVSFPLFTRMFTVSDYGLIDFAQKLLLLATALGKAGMQNSTLRFFDRSRFAQTEGSERSFYSTMFFGTAMVSVGLTALFVLGVKAMPSSVIDAPLASALLLISVLISFRSLQSIQLSFLRIEERTKSYNLVSLGGKALLIVSVVIAVAFMGKSVTAYLVGIVATDVGVGIALTFPLLRRKLLGWKAIDWTLLASALGFGIPLVLQELAGIVLDTGDRALVRSYLGNVALGHYSVAYGLAGYVSTLLMLPLSLAILPIYMRIWRNEGREKTIQFLSIGLNIFLLVAAGLFAVATVASQDAVVLLASAKYRVAAPLIPTLVAGLLIYAVQVFLTAGLVIKKDTRTVAFVLGIAAVLNIGLNCLMLPRMGIQGAAVATLVSYLCSTLLLAKLSFKVLPLKVQVRSLVAYVAAAAAIAFTVPRLDLHSALGNLFGKSLFALLLYGVLVFALDPRFRLQLKSLHHYFQGKGDIANAV